MSLGHTHREKGCGEGSALVVLLLLLRFATANSESVIFSVAFVHA